MSVITKKTLIRLLIAVIMIMSLLPFGCISRVYATEKCTITFDANGGTGEMESVEVNIGEKYKLPANGFTAPAEQRFYGWIIPNDLYYRSPNYEITVTESITIKPKWEYITHYLSVRTKTNDASQGKIQIKQSNGEYTELGTSYGQYLRENGSTDIKAVANEGYHFKEWEVSYGSGIVKRIQDAETTVTMGKKDINYYAVFEDDSQTVSYELYIGNTQVTSKNRNDILNDNGSVRYNSVTNTLTLNNAVINGTGNEDTGYGIKYLGEADLNIVANGTNVVTDEGTRKQGSAAIAIGGEPGVYGDINNNHTNVTITVNANSTLLLYGGEVNGGFYPVSYGILSMPTNGTVTINGEGTLSIYGSNVAAYSYGINIANNLIINSTGKVNIFAGSVQAYSCGVWTYNFTVNSGIVNIMAGEADSSYGIYSYGEAWQDNKGLVAINGGTVLAMSDDGTKSTGTRAEGGIIINNGSFESRAYSDGDEAKAISKIPTLGEGMIAGASTSSDEGNLEIYNSDNNDSYKRFLVPVTTHTVTFNTNGGTEFSNQNIIDGEKVPLPEKEPTKAGNTFGGWYKDSELTQVFIFDEEAIKEDTTIYAKWNEVHVHSFDNGTITKEATYDTEGVKTYTCPKCGATKTEKIEKLTRTSIVKVTVTGIKNKTYNGKKQTQKITVKSGNKILKDGTDYTLVYKNNKKVGTSTIVITGKGAYEGIVNKTFKINPKGTSLKKLTAKSTTINVTWKKQKTQTTGYQIQCSTNKKFKSDKKTSKVKKNKITSSTIKSLKAKKKYYIRIRTYKTVSGKTYYSDWSKAKNVTTKK